MYMVNAAFSDSKSVVYETEEGCVKAPQIELLGS
jgi:hypothetical protein